MIVIDPTVVRSPSPPSSVRSSPATARPLPPKTQPAPALPPRAGVSSTATTATVASSSSEADSGIGDGGSDRSRRDSPLEMELKSLNIVPIEPAKAPPSSESGGGGSSFDLAADAASGDAHYRADASYAESDELMYWEPKLGIFGAPACRWTSSVMALVGMMSGVVFATAGACILVFFVDEEPTVWPLGVTLGAVGALMTALGAVMWASEFMCDDCLGRVHQKIRDAPIKNAIKRRSRMASRAASSSSSTAKIVSCSSRLSDVSYRTAGTIRNVAAIRY